ncbi:MAG: hydrogenase nickel incorporation protein HypB [Lachnospira sp.]|nr:hydrogenase nickel incorporation protein HypB [Lachnospira sp.]
MKVIELNESVTESNDQDARDLSGQLTGRGILLVNLMSSPGSGKTTLLKRLASDFAGEPRMAVLEADIASDVDAVTMEEAGVMSVQAHTDGMCHMDAGMTRRGLEAMDLDGIDIVFLENVGNLICPAEFATGAQKSVMILSVPEGDDKPLKYPLMFSESDALVITKTDALPYFDFDIRTCEERAKRLNPDLRIFPVSAKTGSGMRELEDWLRAAVRQIKQEK